MAGLLERSKFLVCWRQEFHNTSVRCWQQHEVCDERGAVSETCVAFVGEQPVPSRGLSLKLATVTNASQYREAVLMNAAKTDVV